MKNKESNTMTKEQCQQLSDSELLEMVQKSQGHTTNFQKYLNCDFSYTFLTNILKSRGYEHGWYKAKDTPQSPSNITVIPMKKPKKTIRQSYIIDEQVAKEWKDFNKAIPYNSVTISLALLLFMANVKAGRIKFELDLGLDLREKVK